MRKREKAYAALTDRRPESENPFADEHKALLARLEAAEKHRFELEQELSKIGEQIQAVARLDDVDQLIELRRRADELPTRLWAAQVRVAEFRLQEAELRRKMVQTEIPGLHKRGLAVAQRYRETLEELRSVEAAQADAAGERRWMNQEVFQRQRDLEVLLAQARKNAAPVVRAPFVQQSSGST
jgi:DNA repair exonuclease SbcCD ATPase subunit